MPNKCRVCGKAFDTVLDARRCERVVHKLKPRMNQTLRNWGVE